MTDKQKRFADEYLIDCNIARAYRAAYPHVKSVVVASTNGGRLLKNAEVKTYIDKQMQNAIISSPVNGTILTKYAQMGEFATTGKPLFKVADLSTVYLRAYFTSDQLSDIKLGQQVKVVADFGGGKTRTYTGKVTWISSESEFTPKSIQTKDTRANLVYAVKIAVRNDGYLKLGLAGNVKLR